MKFPLQEEQWDTYDGGNFRIERPGGTAHHREIQRVPEESGSCRPHSQLVCQGEALHTSWLLLPYRLRVFITNFPWSHTSSAKAVLTGIFLPSAVWLLNLRSSWISNWRLDALSGTRQLNHLTIYLIHINECPQIFSLETISKVWWLISRTNFNDFNSNKIFWIQVENWLAALEKDGTWPVQWFSSKTKR